MYFIPKVCSQCSDISGAMARTQGGGEIQGCGGGGGIEFPFSICSIQVVRHPKEYSAVKLVFLWVSHRYYHITRNGGKVGGGGGVT